MAKVIGCLGSCQDSRFRGARCSGKSGLIFLGGSPIRELFAAKANIVPGPGSRRRACRVRRVWWHSSAHLRCAARRGLLAEGLFAAGAARNPLVDLFFRPGSRVWRDKSAGGKPCSSIARHIVIRLLNKPRATKSRYLRRIILASHVPPPSIGGVHEVAKQRG